MEHTLLQWAHQLGTLEYWQTLLDRFGDLGPLAPITLAVVESFFPPLPLIAIVALNVGAHGGILGFLYSWIGVALGGTLMFLLWRRIVKRCFWKIAGRWPKLEKAQQWVNHFDTSSEPGIVWVSQDANEDGAPNDTWYELRGSEYDNAETIRDYKITYIRPAEAGDEVTWKDNQNDNGTIDRVKEHTQAYYPEWIVENEITFAGTRLPNNIGESGGKWTMEPFAWGYADNYSASDRIGMTNRLRISDAVTADGAPANLSQVDFIMVQTGVNAKAPLIGEVSTEVSGIGCYRTVTKKQ